MLLPCEACEGGEYSEIGQDPALTAVSHEQGLNNLVMFADGSLGDYAYDTSFDSSDGNLDATQ